MCLTKRTIERYGEAVCVKALKLHNEGNGGLTVGHQLCLPEDDENFTCDFQYEDLGDELIDTGRAIEENTLKV